MSAKLINREQLQGEIAEAIRENRRRSAGQTESMAALMSVMLKHLASAVEKRLEELERAPLIYDGPYESGKEYRKGTFVTLSGSLWHCNYTTDARPGDGPAWTMAVKKGRDAA